MATRKYDLDLTKWKLGLPVDANGTTTGVALEIKTNLEQYENPLFFKTAADGSTIFTATVDGATTKGSKYARSELREMNGDKIAYWNLKEGGTMTATLKLTQAPKYFDGTVGKMVIGQIHGHDEELVRLYWNNGKVYFVNDKGGAAGKETIYDLFDSAGKTPDVSLNETFSYKIDAHGDKLVVEVYADGKTYTSSTAINPVWQTDEFYFKAGVYLGVNETQGTGTGEAVFNALDYSHKAGEGLGGLIVEKPAETTPVVTTDKIVGSAESDTIKGTAGADKLYGRGGNDTLKGGDGNDHIRGNAGNDEISGGNGNDRIYGDDGADKLYGNNGNDTIYGGYGADWIKGGDGKDVFAYTSILDAGDIISDFRYGEKLDLSALVDTFANGGKDMAVAQLKINEFLIIKDAGDSVNKVYVDVDGAKGAGKAVLLATVYGDDYLKTNDAIIA